MSISSVEKRPSRKSCSGWWGEMNADGTVAGKMAAVWVGPGQSRLPRPRGRHPCCAAVFPKTWQYVWGKPGTHLNAVGKWGRERFPTASIQG